MRDETLNLKVYHTHPSACRVERAEKTLKDTAVPGGVKWCMPYKLVNSNGFWMYPPADIEITWHGGKDFTYKMLEDYGPDEYNHISSLIKARDVKDFEKWCSFGNGRTKYTWGSVDVGVVQIYTGCIFKTDPNWCMQIRSPVNFQRRSQFFVMEALIETDWLQYDIWLNLVFTEKLKPVTLRKTDLIPIAQLVPIHRQSFTSDWNLSTEMLNDTTQENKDVLNFYVGYNKRKFASGGKNMINKYANKDSTTYVKVKKEMLNKDGSCKGRSVPPARTKKVLFGKPKVKRIVPDDKQ
jgi:hypothetical protein